MTEDKCKKFMFPLKLGLILMVLSLAIIACQTVLVEQPIEQVTNTEVNNAELEEMYSADQADRFSQEINWKIVGKKDKQRKARVKQLIKNNLLNTSDDYQNAAMIFQHGSGKADYEKAVSLMRKAVELDSTANKWLLAAAIDRYRLSKHEPQIYGTQYDHLTFKLSGDESWTQSNIDTTLISDAERIEYGVPTLAQQREKVKRMNRKKLSELNAMGKTTNEIIQIIRDEDKTDPEYDISESGINDLGYELLFSGRENEALEIFKLNIELFPNEWNTYDSYGECLLKLGDEENAIIAYKKSLELNPKNVKAATIILNHK